MLPIPRLHGRGHDNDVVHKSRRPAAEKTVEPGKIILPLDHVDAVVAHGHEPELLPSEKTDEKQLIQDRLEFGDDDQLRGLFPYELPEPRA